MKTSILISALVLGAMTFASAATNDITSAIQRGLFEEEANQNLGAAIQAYQSVASQFDKDRKLAATAIFRLGECYRKQGNTNDAATQYDRILREFSDQPTLVTLSRQDLATLGSAPPPAADAATSAVAAAQAQVMDLENQLAAIKGLPKDVLRIAIQQGYPNPVLTSLMQNLAEAEQRLATVRKQFGPNNVEVHAAEALVETVNKQIDAQVEVVLRGLEIKRDAAKRTSEMLAALGSAPPAVAAPVLSDAARQEQKRLLEEEIKLVQKHSDEQKKQMQAGLLVSSDDRLATERDLLHLKRQVAALDAGLPVSFTTTETTAPAASTEADEVKRIQALIKDSPDLINAPLENGMTLLQSAAQSGKLAVVRALLESGAAVDGLGQPGPTPLMFAADNGHKAVIDLLLRKRAKADAESDNGVTALHLASRKGYEAVAKALLAAGALVNAHGTKDVTRGRSLEVGFNVGSDKTPLHLAAFVGYPGMVELLLANGAAANVEDFTGRTPLSYATQRHYEPVVKLLLAAHANPNAGASNLPLTEAAFYGDMPALKLLLANGAASDLNTNVTGDFWQIPGVNRGSGGNATPLAAAVSQKHADAVAELIRAKADPNGSTPDGYPLIVWALGDASTLKALLEGGADPNRPDRDGTSPLLRAVMEGAQPAVELLLAHKADANVGRPQYGWTPLHEAAQRGSKGIAEVLLKAGADVNAKAPDGSTPLHIAVPRKQLEVAELLLANHADPNSKNKEGQTPLHLAVANGSQREMAELLLANKADPNERDNQGRTSLDYAKSMAQQPQPMRLAMPPGPSGQPLSVSIATQEREPKPETMADLLRRHGALDDLPHLDQIGARRSSIGVSEALLTKSTQDWSQFTLLDLIAMQYKLLAAGPDQGAGTYSSASRIFGESRLPFPDLAHLHISRPAPDLKSWRDQVVDLTPVVESGDCAKDVPLRWGDVVEIPEADHPLNEKWTGFSNAELANLRKCLTRKVEIVVKGQTTTVTLAPRITGLGEDHDRGTPIGPGPSGLMQYQPTIYTLTPFWLRPVLLESKLVLISSDLSRVKVTRRDLATGKTREWVVDCSKGGESAPDFWLQDGDRIEVPEKT